MVSLLEIRRATLWVEHAILSRYAETDDRAFFRETTGVAPFSLKIGDSICPIGFSALYGWQECELPPGLAWERYKYVTMSDLIIGAGGKYFAYLETADNSPWGVYTNIIFETVQLVKNPSFELASDSGDKPRFWELHSVDGVAEWSSDYVSGYASLRLTGNSYALSNYFDVEPDTCYYWEFWAKGKAARIGIHLSFYDENKQHISSLSLWYNDFDSDWVVLKPAYKETWKSPEGAKYGRVHLWVENGDAYFDNVIVLPWDDTPDRMRVCMQTAVTESHDKPIELWLSGNYLAGLGDKPLSTDLRVPWIQYFEITFPQLVGYNSARFCLRHTSREMMFGLRDFLMLSNEEKSKMIRKIKNFWYGEGFLDYDWYDPYYRASDGHPDDYFWNDSLNFHDVDVWKERDGLVGFGRYMYWSRVGVCRALTCGSTFLDPNASPASLAHMAVHLMNKYGDPTFSINIGQFTNVSAENLLLYGYERAGRDVIPLKNLYDGNGVAPVAPPLSDITFYYTTNLAISLIAFTELGYGFNYAEAKEIADSMVETLIKLQVGYPETIKTSPFAPSGKEGLLQDYRFGLINRPDIAGSFVAAYVVEAGSPRAFIDARVRVFPWGFALSLHQPEEWGQWPGIEVAPDADPIPTYYVGGFFISWMENCLLAHRALRVYEWYKFRGHRGRIPVMMNPADLNGDGVVSVEDLLTLQKSILEGSYCPVGDLNADGILDEKDIQLIEQNLTEPIRGVLWLPALSTKKEVKIY